jgi:P27 family predicted phage terminase small subunit
MIDPKDHKKSQEELNNRKAAEDALRAKGILSCPKTMSKGAQKEWRRVMKLYKGMEQPIICALDRQALIMYCEATAIYEKASADWASKQEVVSEDPKVQQQIDKCFSLMEKQLKIIASISEQLCLTPVGRARMGMASRNTKKKSKIDNFMDEE